MKKPIQIAIDGPAGAGKSSVAKKLADKLGFIYVDTGAMYRALTYKALKNGINLSNERSLVELAKITEITFGCGKAQKVFCDGEDVTELIRSPQVSQKVSLVAAYPEVRKYMVKMQQSLGQNHNIIMDGRDIGTVVLPHAQYKFFLTASLEERAKRRKLELEKKGYRFTNDDIIEEIAERDKLDSQREVGPLKPAEDAIVIDTSNLTLNEVINKILAIILGENNDAL